MTHIKKDKDIEFPDKILTLENLQFYVEYLTEKLDETIQYSEYSRKT